MRCRTLMVLAENSILKATLSGSEFLCFAQHPTASSEKQGFAASFVAQPLILVRPCRALIIRSISELSPTDVQKSWRWWARMSTFYPTLTQCAVVSTALKVLLLPA